MSVAVGRISPLHLTNIATITRGRGSLSLDGRVGVTDPALTAALAAQFDGLSADVDDPVVPLVFTGAHANLAHLNGFYRVASSRVDIAEGTVDPTDPIGWPEWKLELDPVRDRSGPRIESILETVLRTNSASVTGTSADPWHAVPASVPVYDDGAGQAMFPDPINLLPTATGNLFVAIDTTNAPPLRRTVSWRCKPADWYVGAATVERKWGATWLPVIGRDLPVTDPTIEEWGISNGLIRLRLDPSAASQFLIEVFTTGAWRTLCTAKFRMDSTIVPYSPARYVAPASVAVIRNSPAEVRVRITGSTAAAMPVSIIDLRLRRGSPLIEIRWQMPNSTGPLGVPNEIATTPNPTLTATGTKAWAAAADGNGNQLVRMTPEGGGIYVNGGDDTFTTAIGFARSGLPYNYTAITAMYYAPSAELVRFVGS